MDKYITMLRKISMNHGMSLSIMLCTLIVFVIFNNLIFHLPHALINCYGDASKNYFTFLYYSLYENGWHTHGMNYPWGEHITFTDNQPLMAGITSFLRKIFHLQLHHIIAIFNFILVTSYYCSTILIYKILRRYDVSQIIAALFTICVVFIYPNNYRVFGHFALSYLFPILTVWYCMISYFKKYHWKYLVLLFIMTVCAPFIHVYHLLLILLFAFFYIVLYFVYNFKHSISHKIKTILPFILVIFALLTFKTIMLFTDTITDRPTEPWGLWNLYTTLNNLFTTRHTLPGKWYSFLFNHNSSEAYDESYNYLGFVTNTYLLFVCITLPLLFFSRWRVAILKINQNESVLLLVGLAAFLLANLFPFRYGLQDWIEYFSALKQFRSTGRIATISYLCFSFAAIIRLNTIFLLLKEKKLLFAAIFIFPFVIFNGIEVFAYAKEMKERSDESHNNYNAFFFKHKDAENKKILQNIGNDYQAIIGFPYFVIGSEKVGIPVYEEIANELYYISLLKNLPIVNVCLSRTSWQQSFEHMRIAAGDWTDKSLFTNTISEKPLLLVCLKDMPQTAQANTYMQVSEYLNTMGRISLYKLDWKKYVALTDSINTTLCNNKEYYEKYFHLYNGFENITIKDAFWGKGSLDLSATDTLTFLDTNIVIAKKDTVEFSVWCKVIDKTYRMPSFEINQYNKFNERIENNWSYTQNASDIFNNWFRTSTIIILDTNTTKLTVKIHNSDKHPAYMIDELLISSTKNSTLMKNDSFILYNNHVIKKTCQ